MNNLIEKYQTLSEDLSCLNTNTNNLRKKLVEFINESCNNFMYGFINTSSFDEYGIPIPLVCYDGGDNPDTESSVFSTLYSITSTDDGGFVVDLEQEHNVDESRILFCDIQDIFESVGLFISQEFGNTDETDKMSYTDINAEYEPTILMVDTDYCGRDLADSMQNKSYDTFDEVIDEINGELDEDSHITKFDVHFITPNDLIRRLNDEFYPSEEYVIKIYIKK